MKYALFAIAAGVLLAADPSAADIMKKVAENQDREQKERARFIYEENIRVTTRRSNGKLAREEVTEPARDADADGHGEEAPVHSRPLLA